MSGYESEQAAEAGRRKLEHAGLRGTLTVESYGQDITNPDGPWIVNVLVADPAKIRVEVAHSDDAAFGVETTRRLALRRGAVAATNGGFYVVDGPLRGDSAGLLVVNGKIWSEPDRGRGAVGFYDDSGTTRALFGRLTLEAHAVVGPPSPANAAEPTRIGIDGIDRERADDQIVLYTPEFHRTTLTLPGGLEVVVANGLVRAIHEGAGSSAIPPDGFVLSAGKLVARRLASLRTGDPVRIETQLHSQLRDPQNLWSHVRYAASAGPLLEVDGEQVLDPATESISRVFAAARHPRTAAGVRADGTLLFVTVDGRNPETSVGMSIPELVDLMKTLGAVSAVNLDGGGSTTMVVQGQAVSAPSDEKGERENGDAILLFQREAPQPSPNESNYSNPPR